MTRTTDAQGRVTDQLDISKDQAAGLASSLKAAGENKLRLVFNNDTDGEKQVKRNFSKDALSLFADNGLDLVFNINGAEVLIPVDSMKESGQAIEMHIAPLNSQADIDAVKQRAETNAELRQTAGDGNVRVLGSPVSIETNLQNHPVTLFIPTGSVTLSEEEQQELGVYIEHSDGTKELVKGRYITNASGVTGIEFEVSKFSLFTVVQVEGWKELLPYLKGYEDGTFKPNASITRAELATILANVFQGEENAAAVVFPDVTDAHWAKQVIDKVVKMGLMKGYENGTFRPDQPITRDEMATIAAILADDKTAAGQRALSDINGHWAKASILKAQNASILNGYEDGTFRPQKQLSRAEAVVLVNNLLGLQADVSGAPVFTDVQSSHWAFGAIQAASGIKQQ